MESFEISTKHYLRPSLHGGSWHGSWQGPFWSISPANPFQYSSVPSSPFQQPHFAVIPPPSLKAHAKKTHFLTRSASFAQFMGLFAPFFKDPYKHPYFLTPHTSPLQRPLQNPLFLILSMTRNQYSFYRAAGYSTLTKSYMFLHGKAGQHYLQVACTKTQYCTVQYCSVNSLFVDTLLCLPGG